MTHEPQTQYVVYTIDSDGKPCHFLAVCKGAREATEARNKWWKAFRSGEKAEPRDYDGVSYRPVSVFDEWKSASDYGDNRNNNQ